MGERGWGVDVVFDGGCSRAALGEGCLRHWFHTWARGEQLSGDGIRVQ